METDERNEIIEICAKECEATCGCWMVPKYLEKLKNPDAKHTCPCAESVRKLKT